MKKILREEKIVDSFSDYIFFVLPRWGLLFKGNETYFTDTD